MFDATVPPDAAPARMLIQSAPFRRPLAAVQRVSPLRQQNAARVRRAADGGQRRRFGNPRD
jgi:hypothetical protein